MLPSRFVLVLMFLAVAAVSLTTCARREPPPNAEKHFVGSEKCASCHQDVYNRWKDTLMAKVIQDPARHPEAIVGDFSTPNPLVTFRKEDIAFTYGSKWKQRYFTKRGDDYYAFPVQWDVRAKTWRRYFVENGTDWWAVHYPPDQMQRPTGPLCAQRSLGDRPSAQSCSSSPPSRCRGSRPRWPASCLLAERRRARRFRAS